jgi:hypothetical protein
MLTGVQANSLHRCPNGCVRPRVFKSGIIIDEQGTVDSTPYCQDCARFGRGLVPCEIVSVSE